MTKRSEKTDKEAYEKLKELGKATVSELAPKLGWTVGKTQYALKRLVDEKKIYRYDVPDYDEKIFRVYYSVVPINDTRTLNPNMKAFVVPKYYKFLDNLFGNMLKDKEGRKIILKHVKQMGLTMKEIIEMQNEAKEEEK